ncbi:hypothetical protein H7F33_00850 [Pedobacter sp. PAMC26386]|nr:hypothetical protein H7F33_00850 [Pedobacter sp. PAMC26386]
MIWILLDEYASPASLESQFNFKDPLVDSLKDKGFFVFDGLHSRSDVTIYSVNSLFNLDYSPPVSNFMYATGYLNKSIWVKRMKNLGFEFISLDFQNIGNHNKIENLRIFPDNYSDQVLRGILFVDIFNNLFEKSAMPFDDYNQMVIKQFSRVVRVRRSKYALMWAHLLIPHPPFYRRTNGEINKSPILDLNTAPALVVTKQYTDYLSYGNSVVLKMLNEIPDWKSKTIIISGDHGARMLISPDDPRRRQPFGAIYYPGMDKNKLSKIKYMQEIPFYLH